MASNSSNQFKQILSAPIFGATPSNENQTANSISQLTQQILDLQTIAQAQTESVQANTAALQQTSTQASSGGGGGSVLDSVGSALGDFFGFGFGLSPIISGIASLFGGGGSSAPPPLSEYIGPAKVSVNAGVSDAFPGQAFGIDYGQGGVPRAVESSPAAGAAPQITVQVQALDSQSFLDRSSDIAAAVRQAMLESSVLSDVIQGV